MFSRSSFAGRNLLNRVYSQGSSRRSKEIRLIFRTGHNFTPQTSESSQQCGGCLIVPLVGPSIHQQPTNVKEVVVMVSFVVARVDGYNNVDRSFGFSSRSVLRLNHS